MSFPRKIALVVTTSLWFGTTLLSPIATAQQVERNALTHPGHETRLELGSFSNSRGSQGFFAATRLAWNFSSQLPDRPGLEVVFVNPSVDLRLDADMETSQSRYDLEISGLGVIGFHNRSLEGSAPDSEELASLRAALLFARRVLVTTRRAQLQADRHYQELRQQLIRALPEMSDYQKNTLLNRAHPERSAAPLLDPDIECGYVSTGEVRVRCIEVYRSPTMLLYRAAYLDREATIETASDQAVLVQSLISRIQGYPRNLLPPNHPETVRAAPSRLFHLGGVNFGFGAHHSSWMNYSQRNAHAEAFVFNYRQALRVGPIPIEICARGTPASLAFGDNRIGATNRSLMFRVFGVACLGVHLGRIAVLNDQVSADYFVGQGSILNFSNYIGLDGIFRTPVGVGYRYEYQRVADGTGSVGSVNSHFVMGRASW